MRLLILAEIKSKHQDDYLIWKIEGNIIEYSNEYDGK